MNLIEATNDKLLNIRYFLLNLEAASYKEPLEVLSFASIGEHTRHILEFYQCLLHQHGNGTINYDLRARNKLTQEDPTVADKVLTTILDSLSYIDICRKLRLEICYGDEETATIEVETSLERELVYNLEHVIHHLAIIKIGLSVVAPQLRLPAGFGIAPSTSRFKKNACVQ